MTNLNPYRPGAGKMPPVLAGRQELLQPVFEDMMRIEEEGTSDQPYVFWGLRGLGKTVFLNEIAQQALKRNWLVVKVEARSDDYLIKQLVQELAITLKRYQPVDGQVASALKRALRVLKSFQLRFDPTGVLAVNLNLDSEEGYADSGDENRDFQDALEAVGIVARELGVGALIAVDELQEAGMQNLKTLNVSLHEIGQAIEPLPVVFIGAGLPTLPSTLAKANSYAERMYKFSEIDLLDDAAVTTALREPAQERGVIWSEAALKTVVTFSKGYPYYVQQCGRCIWDVRDAEDAISEQDADLGMMQARIKVDQGLYRARWGRVTPVGREMMIAMARLGGEAAISDVVVEMGRESQSDVSNIRDRLINDGQIYSPARGMVAFTVPGMDEYILRNELSE